VGYAEQYSTPAMAASAAPMAKVMEMVRLMLMPMSWAAPRSSDTARMALPIFVLDVKIVSAVMMMTAAMMVTIASPVTVSRPAASWMGFSATTEVKLLGLDDQMSSAAF
jgi:hypothetical protein